MPTYEYVCEKCGHQFEKVQPITAKALSVCPKESCAQKAWGKGKVKRAISAGGGIIFKGSGFYSTDYRSENYKEAAKKDSAASSGTSGEAKPVSSSEAKPGSGNEAKSASGSDKKPAPAKADTKAAKPSSDKG